MSLRRCRNVLMTLAVGAGLVVAGAPAVADARPLPQAPNCRIFPANNPWNQRVDHLPVHPRSSAIIRAIGPGEEVHADFGSGRWNGGPIGIPYTTVGAGQPRVSVSFEYADESDRGPYPIPRNAPIEGGPRSDGDRHVLVVDRSSCRLFELYAAHPVNGGARWRAGSGAIFNLNSNALRPAGWTSADAAGLPILPGLARYDEVAAGVIDHALRFTVERTRRAYVYPARHFASNDRNPNLPAMGQRLRLKRSVNPARFPGQARVIVRALQRYGMLLADNGSSGYL
jgi:hypothetical protein